MIINKKVDKIVHEPVRLDILNLLAELEYADFLFLLNECDVTKGNLSSHLIKLENAKYIDVKKGYNLKKPVTEYRITKNGRAALEKYKEVFMKIL